MLGVSQGQTKESARTRLACVYTALLGDYEPLNEQEVARSSRLPFICLTDNPRLRSETWQIRQVRPLFAMDPVRSQRALKLRPHEYLPDFDASLYIDNSVLLKSKPEWLIEEYLGDSGFSVPRHGFHKSLRDEFIAVEEGGLDDPARILEQLTHYLVEDPGVLEEQPFWTGILLRDHRNARVRAMLELWWAYVQRYSRRDQLSINVALRREGLEPQILEIDNFSSPFHSWPHIAGRKKSRSPRAALPTHVIARLGKLERRNERLNTARAKLKKALAEQKRQNKALQTSASWRLTAPMRAAAKICSSFAHRLANRSEAVKKKKVAFGQPACSSASDEHAAFLRDGFVGPVDLLAPVQCRLVLAHHRLGARRGRRNWPKDLATTDRFFFDLASHPQLVSRLKPLLGDDIILWGASVVEREPGQTHIWHSDIETATPDGRFVTVWVGLENTCQELALQLISRSHAIGRPIQQEVHERGFRRGEATNEMIIAWAREHDASAEFHQPEMHDGQVLLLDGRLWHGSHNSSKRRRSALLLQYAAAGTPIAIPAFDHVEWPFRFTADSPPSVLIAGDCGKSDVVPPPSPGAGASPISIHTHTGHGFAESADGWIPYPLLHGPTPIFAAVESHVSVLSPGHSPHPPHCHVEEELLIVLKGEAEILIAKSSEVGDARVERLGAGSFVYYPAYQYHTIRNSSDAPVTYLMFKWQRALADTTPPLETSIFDINASPPANSNPMAMRVLFESPTHYLTKLHAHVTDLQPGAGYPAHVDDYDVAIVVFSGCVETSGTTVGPGGSIYYAAGEPHGMMNGGSEPARYLVFEFHSPRLLGTDS